MADKTEKFIQSSEGGVMKVKVQEDIVKSPALSDEQAVEIAKLLMELEEAMTKPQDFEWGIEKGSE
jgi:pyruvate,water dikinase